MDEFAVENVMVHLGVPREELVCSGLNASAANLRVCRRWRGLYKRSNRRCLPFEGCATAAEPGTSRLVHSQTISAISVSRIGDELLCGSDRSPIVGTRQYNYNYNNNNSTALSQSANSDLETRSS